jgi:hypothetical protein
MKAINPIAGIETLTGIAKCCKRPLIRKNK